MRSLLLLLLTFLFAPGQSFAQDADAYQKSFDAGIAALSAGRLDEGIAAFKKCIEIEPADPISPYNVACGYARKAEKDSVFEWLDKAANLGFGNLYDAGGTSNLSFCQSDTDLTSLHDDPRWAKFVEQMTTLRKPWEEFIATPALYVPKALEGAQELALLVVLHDLGKSKNSVIEGRWKHIADELGCALLAPSGKIPMKPLDLGAGMSWFNSPLSYPKTFRNDERPVFDALLNFQKTHKLIAERVFIAGDGIGATVAFNIATAKSSAFRGVVMVDGIVISQLAGSRVAGASKAGLRVHAIFNKAKMTKALKGREAQPVIDTLARNLTAWKLINKVEGFEPVDGQPDPTEAMALAALRSFLVPLPAPAEAGSGK